MAAFADHTDLSDRWRTLTAAEQTRADVLLGSASRIIRHAYPTVDARIADASLDADIPVDVACFMVQRVMISAGLKQSTRQIGQVSVAETYADAEAAGLYLTDHERALLEPEAGTEGTTSLPVGSFPEALVVWL